MESEHFYALHNHAPILPGHSLVIPKRHIARLADLPPAASRELIPFAQDVARALGLAFGAADFDLSLQDGHAAGQTVDHLHLHLFPRHPGDLPRPGDWYKLLADKHQLRPDPDHPRRPRLPRELQEQISSQLRRAARRLDPNELQAAIPAEE